MANFGRGITYVIAAQVQAVMLLAFAWWAGGWMNDHWPKDFSWYVVTIPVSVLAMAQTFYVVIRQVMRESKADDAAAAAKTKVKPSKGS